MKEPFLKNCKPPPLMFPVKFLNFQDRLFQKQSEKLALFKFS